MKSFRTFLFLGALLLLVFVLIVFRVNAIHFFEDARIYFFGLFDRSFSYRVFEDLRSENLLLKQIIQETKQSQNNSVFIPEGLKEAEVYSRYPFNDKNLLIINRGSRDGVMVGMPVVVNENVIVGKIKAVMNTQSEVQTIFDPGWKSSVNIGAGGTKAILVGGVSPELQLIAKNEHLAGGDIVKNISPDLPFHFLLGTIERIKKDATDAWLTGTLKPFYITENLTRLFIVTNFP